MSQDLVRKIENPVVINPKNGLVYKDDIKTDVWELDWKNMEPILDGKTWAKSKSASVNDPFSGEPRCPLVPKLTIWFGFPKSGRRS